MSENVPLSVIIWFLFCDNSTKEELLTVLPLKGKMRDKNIYQTFKAYVSENKLSFQKLVWVTTNGVSAFVVSRNDFIDPHARNMHCSFPTFITYHCIIH
jgi:hypothetical protein